MPSFLEGAPELFRPQVMDHPTNHAISSSSLDVTTDGLSPEVEQAVHIAEEALATPAPLHRRIVIENGAPVVEVFRGTTPPWA